MARMTAQDEPFSRWRNVRKVYRSQGAEFLAVSDVTMDVQEGELISLVGPSGCGKTTVLKILAGLHDADGGTIQFGNSHTPVSYTHLRAHETRHDLVCRLLLE